MDFSEYQAQALKTDQTLPKEETSKIIPLLGLAGEAGELLSEYKKFLRDGEAHKLHPERIKEELGDLLWYIANLSSKFGLELEDVAKYNLEKCLGRWGCKPSVQTGVYIFDKDFPKKERLPRKFEVEITEERENSSDKIIKVSIDGNIIGDKLTDNSYSSDGYRFHDIFHFSYAAILGWSPVIRSMIKRKRKSIAKIDEVEDGGRAIVIEEGISALVFSYAQKHNFLEGISTLDYQLLKTVKSMTEHLEVSKCSLSDWEKAILIGYEVWRQVKQNQEGKIVVDLDTRSLIYKGSVV